jgi:branched-chain amino acid transport system permease protein
MSGAILGAMTLTIVPEVLRRFSEWRLVVYGLALVLIMLYRPNGICGGAEFPFLIPRLEQGGAKGEEK